MKSWEKKENIKKANLILEANHLWGNKLNTLSEEHIKYVLGIELPLNESYYGNPILIERIIQEQMLYEDFLKSLKDFAKEKINVVVDKIKDWKETAAFIYKLITDPKLLQNFSDNFWKTFKKSTLNDIKVFLTKFKLEGVFESIQNVIDKITQLTGFKKFLAATAFAAISKYMINKLKALPSDKITGFISNYLSETFLKDIISKLTDFKSYLGVLQPIIGTTEFLFKVLEPTINKFRSAINLLTQKKPSQDDGTLDFSTAQ
jgi:hypothetical protein